jgi:hypothetical protein
MAKRNPLLDANTIGIDSDPNAAFLNAPVPEGLRSVVNIGKDAPPTKKAEAKAFQAGHAAGVEQASAPIQQAPSMLPGTAPAAPAPAAPPPDPLAGARAEYDVAADQAAQNKAGSQWQVALNILGGGSDASTQGIRDRANAPLTALMAKRDAARKAMEDSGAEAELRKKMALDDPSSSISQDLGKLLVARGIITPAEQGHFRAGMYDDLMKGANFAEAHKAHQDSLQMQKDELASNEKRSAAGLAANAREGSLNRAQNLKLHAMDNAANLAEKMAAVKATAAKGDETTKRLLDEVSARQANITQNGAKLKALIAKYGTSEKLVPGIEAQMEQLANAIAVDTAKLQDPNSAARSDEVARERANIFQPGMFQRDSTAEATLDSYLAQNQDRARNAFAVRGVPVPASFGQAPAGGAAPAPAAPAAPRKFYSPSRNQTKLVYPDGREETVNGRA